jgi:uncharacterized protein DUF6529
MARSNVRTTPSQARRATRARVRRFPVSSRDHLLVAALAGALVAVALGVYGGTRSRSVEQPYTLFFTGTLNLKAWFATLTLALAIVQIWLALRLYGKLSWPRTLPTWWGDLHRLVGILTFLASLPVAYHCLWALGLHFTDAAGNDSTRILVHSLLGCAFYGAFTTKVLCVRMPKVPGSALPVVGGLVFAILVGLWLTSSLWFFRNIGFPAF